MYDFWSQGCQDWIEILEGTLMLILFFNFNVPSSVHGHWLLARAAALFPGTDLARNVSILFDQQFTAEKARMAVGGETWPSFRLVQSWPTSSKSLAAPLRELMGGPGFSNFKKSLKLVQRFLSNKLSLFANTLDRAVVIFSCPQDSSIGDLVTELVSEWVSISNHC